MHLTTVCQASCGHTVFVLVSQRSYFWNFLSSLVEVLCAPLFLSINKSLTKESCENDHEMSLLIVEQSNEEISAGNNSLKERNKNINHSNNIVKDTPKRKYEEKKVHRVCIPTRVQKRNEKVRF